MKKEDAHKRNSGRHVRKIIAWLKMHSVFAWAVISIIFAVVLHIAFCIDAPVKWLVAKWTPGDMLTYAGTVSLGLLAFWQNKRFKEENDASQERLERLSFQANELTAINKIIEIEDARLGRLRTAFDDFYTACSPQTIAVAYVEAVKNLSVTDVTTAMVDAEKSIDDSFFVLSRELRADSKLLSNDEHPLKISISNYYRAAKSCVEEAKNGSAKDLGALTSVLTDVRNEFISQRERYLISKEDKLNAAIYGSLSLREIKSLYCDEK